VSVTNEGRVYFALYGKDFDPNEVTRLVGIEPTRAQRKGDPRPKHSIWKVSTDHVEDEAIDIYEMSSTLVARLRPFAERIAEVKQQLGLEAVLEVVLRITTDDTKSTPVIGFDTEVITFLNAVGAYIDVDTYRNTGSESVWLLQHVHEFDDGSEDVKLIGVFASREEGEVAQGRVASEPGFRDTPDGFSLTEERLGIVAWGEGYVTNWPER